MEPVHIREPDPESKLMNYRLHLAILRGKIVSVSKLLHSGKKCSSDFWSLFLWWYSFAVFANQGVPVELANEAGQTPLFCAAFRGHFDIVKILLKLGADPNRRCSILYCTPVHAACWSGNENLLRTNSNIQGWSHLRWRWHYDSGLKLTSAATRQLVWDERLQIIYSLCWFNSLNFVH